MADCKHENLEFVGEQKTDSGVNSYYRCKSCEMLLIMTPTRKVIGIKGVHSERPAPAKRSAKS